MKRLLIVLAVLAAVFVPTAAWGAPSDGIVDSLCPPRSAPLADSPSVTGVPPLDPNIPVDQQAQVARYGYDAGLFWTTYDVSCLSMDKLDTTIGSALNSLANQLDGMVNQVREYAFDPHSTDAATAAIPKTLLTLKAAFWDTYVIWGLAAAAILIAVLAWFGRATSIALAMGNLLLVLAGVGFLLTHPTTLTDTSNALTSRVAHNAANAMIGAAGTRVPQDQALAEGYGQIAYRAWVAGWTCGDQDAERRYAARLRADQAWSIPELGRNATAKPGTIHHPSTAQKVWSWPFGVGDTVSEGDLAKWQKAKQADWLKLADEMKATNPVAFACWSGQGHKRFGAGIEHLLATIGAGVWVLLSSGGIIVCKYMLIFALLVFVALAAMMLLTRRAATRHYEFILMAFVGPPIAAIVASIVICFYWVLLSDTTTAWWSAVVACIAFGFASFLSLRWLRRAFVGLAAFEIGSHVGRHGRRAYRRRRRYSSAGHAAVAADAGYVAGRTGDDGDDRVPTSTDDDRDRVPALRPPPDIPDDADGGWRAPRAPRAPGDPARGDSPDDDWARTWDDPLGRTDEEVSRDARSQAHEALLDWRERAHMNGDRPADPDG